MTIPEIQPSSNGKHEAPQETSGAFHMAAIWEAPEQEQRRRRRTEFLPELPADSLRAFFYKAYRHELGGVSLTRWFFSACLALAFIWLVGVFPGRWIGVAFWLVAALAGGLTTALLRRRNFVRFYAGTLPAVTPRPAGPEDKFAAYVTGHFTVEGRYARFTMLPGFYRTFATREHALLCLVRDSRFLRVGRWMADQVGMWYVFFMPDEITDVQYGKLQFDRTLHDAIAVTYQLTTPATGKLKREQTVLETVYIVPGSEEGGRRILADLLYERVNIVAAAQNESA